MDNVELLVSEVVKRVQEKIATKAEVKVEMSARHIHLSQEDLETLFGKGYQLTPKKALSQPGQYASEERISVLGPKGMIQNVSILGPVRAASQVEMSLSDLRTLGLKTLIRESGHLEGTSGVTLLNGQNVVTLTQGLIVAQRHVHMTPADAEKFGLKNDQIVKVKVAGTRPLIFDDVVIRVSDKYATYMHLDTDEANACGYFPGMCGEIIQ